MKVKESQDFEEALAKVGSPLARVKLIAAGVEQLMRADMLRAEAFVNEALPLARKLQRRGEVRKGYCRLLYTHGLLNHSRGNFPEADSAFAEALKLARKLGERSHGTRARSQDKASYNARDVDRPTSQLSECGGGGDWLCCQRKLQSITRRVRQQSQSEQEWKSFEQQLENLNHDFMAKLGKKFPKLSPTELKICASLKVSLGSKEMASVLCVTIRAIETYRLRIRMKLGLSQSNNLGSSLAIFHENIIRASSFQISLLHRSIVFVAAGFNRRLHVSNQFQSSIGAQYRIEMNRRNMSLRRSFAALDVTILPVETGGYCWRRLFG